MTHIRPILALAAFLFLSMHTAPAATPVPLVDYMLTSRTVKIVLDCDPPSCRILMNRELDFENDNTWVLSRAKHWVKDWGRFRVLDDIHEADLVLHLDCGQPNFRNILYGLRYRWIKMEVYAGGDERWQQVAPIWRGELDPMPACDCRDAVVHILTAYRSELEQLDRARGRYLPSGPPRLVLKPNPLQDKYFCFPLCK
jgi:hypothetical protein